MTKDRFYTIAGLPIAETFDLYARSFGSSYAKSFFWFMWGIMRRLVAYTMFFVIQSWAAL